MSRPSNTAAPDTVSPHTIWSRRRAGVRAEARAEREAGEQLARAAAQAEQQGRCDADILHDLNLKDPDQMQAGDDFSAFMLDQVPERLRRRALRVLWRSNPVLACVDDLVDYGDDFKAEWSGAVIKTAYRVGKGMASHLQELEKQRLAGDAPDMPDNVPEQDARENVDTMADAGAASPDEAIPEPGCALVPEPEPHEDRLEIPPARHMRFEFDGVA